jgi:predicted enzyme related to lactoylglutathione lyase
MGDVSFYGIDLDACHPGHVARFWAGVLGWSYRDEAEGSVVVTPGDSAAYRIVVRQTDSPKTGQNRIHLDLTSSSLEAMEASISRALDLGGRRIDIGQTPEDRHEVLADPEGNEFCVIEPGNSFLADTGVIGAINCDGTRALGYFWSEVLGWPLVWDEDEETAIQAPNGGSKITWSGPPLMPRQARDRLRLVLAVDAGAEVDAAVSRLVALGATRTETNHTVADGVEVLMTDPDGNEFRVLAKR